MDMFSKERMDAYTTFWPEYHPYTQAFGEFYKEFRDAFLVARSGRVHLGTIEVLLAYSGGRVMATFRDGDRQVTLVGDATGSDPRFGLHTYEGSINEAGGLLRRAVSDGARTKREFVPDDSVRIA